MPIHPSRPVAVPYAPGTHDTSPGRVFKTHAPFMGLQGDLSPTACGPAQARAARADDKNRLGVLRFRILLYAKMMYRGPPHRGAYR